MPLSVATRDTPVEVVPATGLAEVLEIRFPVSPNAALILTWYDHPEGDRTHAGTFEQSCSINASVIAQADRHWMRHPNGTAIRLRPAGLRAIADPISPQLLENHNPGAAAHSRRRSEARSLVADLIERAVTDYVGWVSLERG